MVTVGGSEAIDLALRALIIPGDDIIVPVPSYIAYSPIVQLNGGLEEMNMMIESYCQRRRMFVNGLREIGLPCHEPRGAFYAFPSVAHTGLSSDEFAQKHFRTGII
ncbi:hypothetical protein PAAL109150_07510 [Paenibacillus alkaliterrae]